MKAMRVTLAFVLAACSSNVPNGPEAPPVAESAGSTLTADDPCSCALYQSACLTQPGQTLDCGASSSCTGVPFTSAGPRPAGLLGCTIEGPALCCYTVGAPTTDAGAPPVTGCQ